MSVLQDKLLASLLGIDDPRSSKRIDFVGGIRGTGELVKRVDAQTRSKTSINELLRD